MTVTALTGLFYGLPIYKFYAYPDQRDVVGYQIQASTTKVSQQDSTNHFHQVMDTKKIYSQEDIYNENGIEEEKEEGNQKPVPV